MEAGQDLDHQKLTSGLWNAFFTGSLDEATNYASHGPVLQSLTFIKHLLKPSEERKRRSVHRSKRRSVHRSVHKRVRHSKQPPGKTLFQKMETASILPERLLHARVKEILLRLCCLFETDLM